MRSLLWVSVLSAALAGCIADGGVGVRANYVAPQPVVVEAQPQPVVVEAQPQEVDVEYVEPTSMVYVNPDVQVIEDYDEPVFFSTNLYWRYDNNVWYSSPYHDRGWVEVNDVPVSIRHIDRPTEYRHYHADNHATVVGQPGYRNPHPVTPPRPAGPPPHRYIPAGGTTAHGTAHEPSHGGAYQPTHPQPAQPVHNGTYEPVHNPTPAPAHNGTYEPVHTQPTHPTAPTQNQQPHPTAPAPHPAPVYKAPPPAKKKK